MKNTLKQCFFFVLCFVLLWRRAEGSGGGGGGGSNNTSTTTTTSTRAPRTFPVPCEERKGSVKADIFIVLLILIFVVGLLGNTAAIATVMFSKRLRTIPTNIFVAALALCDIGAILFIIPIRLDTYLYERNFCFNIHVCRMFNLSDLLFHIGSISHLFVIALERYFAVNHPFFYQRTMSKEKTVIGISCTWLYALFWACMSLVDVESTSKPTMYIYQGSGRRLCVLSNRVYFNVIYFVIYIIPLAVMGVIYTLILRVALKQARIIESLSINKDRSDTKKHRREVRATKTLAIVYGAFTVCWLPLTIIVVTSKWWPASYKTFVSTQPILAEVVFALFIEILPTFNSCLNPFVYILFNQKFRQEMTILWQKMRRATPTFTINSDSSVGANSTTNSAHARVQYFGEQSRAYVTNSGGGGENANNSISVYKRFSHLGSGTVSPAFESGTLSPATESSQTQL